MHLPIQLCHLRIHWGLGWTITNPDVSWDINFFLLRRGEGCFVLINLHKAAYLSLLLTHFFFSLLLSVSGFHRRMVWTSWFLRLWVNRIRSRPPAGDMKYGETKGFKGSSMYLMVTSQDFTLLPDHWDKPQLPDLISPPRTHSISRKEKARNCTNMREKGQSQQEFKNASWKTENKILCLSDLFLKSQK